MRNRYGRSKPHYRKVTAVLNTVEEQFSIDDFTDGGSTSGYVDLDTKLPIGAIPLGWRVDVSKAFKNTAEYTPEDGTNIVFLQEGSADTIMDFTGVVTYTPEDGTDLAFTNTTNSTIMDFTDAVGIAPVDGTTLAFTNTTHSTITDSEEGFLDAGFEDGDVIYISGSTANDGVYTIGTVAAGTLTFVGEVFAGAETGINGIKIRVINEAETGGFVEAGFEAGDKIYVSGSTGNNGIYTIGLVEAGRLTFTGEVFAGAEAGINGVKIRVINEAETGGFVDALFTAGDSIVVDGSTSNDDTYTIVSVKAGVITLGDDVFTAAEVGIEGVNFYAASTATIMVGIAGDTDRFSADTSQSVGATGSVGSVAIAAHACKGMAAANTVRVTITEGSDFGELLDGEATLTLFYIRT
jgi:hypothetical protein